MNLVNSVFEIAESFMKDPQYVSLDDERIEALADDIKKSEKPKFPLPDVSDFFTEIVYELVAASVNYCYWYGKSDIRPNKANSTLMYQLMMNAFYDFDKNNVSSERFSECIDRFKRLLSINRFPLLEERHKHLDELKKDGLEFCIKIKKSRYKINRHKSLNYYLSELIELFPGFASDIFLKRASLFFIQLNRRLGWFDDELKNLHVPADYQIPKMLEYLGCISYNNELFTSIQNNQLIPKNSIQECEIRAATILAMKKLCELTEWNVADVDGFLFLQRDGVYWPFHLTITTDY